MKNTVLTALFLLLLVASGYAQTAYPIIVLDTDNEPVDMAVCTSATLTTSGTLTVEALVVNQSSTLGGLTTVTQLVVSQSTTLNWLLVDGASTFTQTISGTISTATVALHAATADNATTASFADRATSATFSDRSTSATYAASTAFDSLVEVRNGSIIETIDGDVVSDGAAITFSLEQSGGGNLTAFFSGAFVTIDTTPAATVALTAGSDTSPQNNYIYILESTGLLTAATGGWPATQHAPVATTIIQCAATVQGNGALKTQFWTDHVKGSNDEGQAARQRESSESAPRTSRGRSPDGRVVPTRPQPVPRLR